MFQLYKIRNFSDLFNDTFAFFRTEGKNYFKNYIIINGVLLIILVVLGFVVGRFFLENFMAAMVSGNSGELYNGFTENAGFFIGAGLFAFILFLIISIVNYSYPVLYLSLYEKTKSPSANEIFQAMKNRLGKILLFGLLFLITFLPLMVITGFVCGILAFLIITIPLLFIVIAAFACWIYLAFYDYISTDNGYFTSMGKAWDMLIKKFWPHVGSTIIFFAIIYILQLIISLVTSSIGSIFMATDVDSSPYVEDQAQVITMVGIIMFIMFAVSIIFTFVLSNLIIINQGMIYYSCREEEENRSLETEIDLIGRDVE